MKNLKKIKGDASTRKFFRKRDKKITSIIVYTKKDKSKNLLVYDAINKILIKNDVLAPSLYQENYKKSFIEIQDFGDQTVFKILKKSKSINKLILFKKIIKVLNKIQSIKNRNIKNFKKQKYIIPKYNNDTLIKEANLFCQWYVDKNLSKGHKEKFTKTGKPKVIKPKRAAVPKDINIEEVEMNLAEKLLSLPRTVGLHPETNLEIKASIGPFGPYLLHDAIYVSVKEDDILDISLERSVIVIKEGLEKKKNSTKRVVGRKKTKKKK